MADVRWLPGAIEDLHRLHAFIAPHSAEAAGRAVNALIDATSSLIEAPEKGRPWPHDAQYRELLVRFGAKWYVIRYRLFEGDVVMVGCGAR